MRFGIYVISLIGLMLALSHPVQAQAVPDENAQLSISGLKYLDYNLNGQFDSEDESSEDSLLNDWLISVYDLNWNVIDTMLTGDSTTEAGAVSTGEFRFVDLAVGEYYVCEESRPDWTQTQPITTHSVSTGSPRCYLVALDGSIDVNQLHFGNVPDELIEDQDGQLVVIEPGSATPKEPVADSGSVLGATSGQVLAETGVSIVGALFIGIMGIITPVILAKKTK